MKQILLIMVLLTGMYLGTKAQEGRQALPLSSYALLKGNTVIMNTTSFIRPGEPGNNDPVKDYDYYMRKKKNNLTGGLVTLGAGVLLSGLGVIIGSNTSAFDDGADVVGVLIIAGGVSGIVSIPLMIMSSVYGRKAKLELSKQKTGFGVPPNVSKDIVGITFQIPIGK